MRVTSSLPSPPAPAAAVIVVAATAAGLGCADDGVSTGRLAVSNGNGRPVTVQVFPLDGDAPETFVDIPPGGTTPARAVDPERFATVRVRCPDEGCVGGGLVLAGVDDVIHVLATHPPSLSTPTVSVPTLTDATPRDGSAGVSRDAALLLRFSEPMAVPSLWAAPVRSAACEGPLRLSTDDPGDGCVALAEGIEEVGRGAYLFRPAEPLAGGVRYTLEVTTAVRSENNVRLAQPVRLSFTTGSALDREPPGRVMDLRAQRVDATEAELRWAAVGDDGLTGAAYSYDLRYHPGGCPFDAAAAVEAQGEPAPAAPGTEERFLLRGLSAGTSYCVTLTVLDDAANRSAPSVPLALRTSTSDDAVPPDPPRISLNSDWPGSIDVSWVAVGDDGTVGQATGYELRYGVPDCPAHDGRHFRSGTLVPELPAPAPAGTRERFSFGRLARGATHCVVLAVRDEAGNTAFSDPVEVTTIRPEDYW